MKTQKQLIKDHLVKKGSISSWTAIQKYRITRLAAIIFVLRDEGWLINSQTRTRQDKHWTEYIYKGIEKDPNNLEIDFKQL